MFKKFTNGCVVLVQKYLPDPFIFCIILTVFVFILAIPLTGQGPIEMVMHWGSGFWSLLAFSMQMALVLVLGTAMADSPPMQKLLKMLSGIPKTPFQSIMFVTLVSLVACWINWGFGLVVGAIFAKEIAKHGRNVDYRLLIASAYSGFVIWHGGMSGSIPLTIANVTAEVTAQTSGVVTESIPTSSTIFALFNLLICALFLICIPLVNAKMHPDAAHVVTISQDLLKEEKKTRKQPVTPAEKMENSRFMSAIVVLIGVVFIVKYFAGNGFQLDLNIVNLIFLTLGVLFHGTPIGYVQAINSAISGAGGILLQFPFYAGIMGMMTGAGAATGLSVPEPPTVLRPTEQKNSPRRH